MGRPAKSIRLILGLLILKHGLTLSDQDVVASLHENLYWMRLCSIWWYPGDDPPGVCGSFDPDEASKEDGCTGSG